RVPVYSVSYFFRKKPLGSALPYVARCNAAISSIRDSANRCMVYAVVLSMVFVPAVNGCIQLINGRYKWVYGKPLTHGIVIGFINKIGSSKLSVPCFFGLFTTFLL